MEQKQKEILTKIKQNEIKMKPKVYFILGGVLLGIGLGLVLLLAVFATNIGFYKLFFGGNFSERVLLLITLFLSTGILLLKHYEFSYKKDFWKLTALLIAGVLLSGLALSQTKINQKAQKMRHLRVIYQDGHAVPPAMRIHFKRPATTKKPTI